MNRLTDLLNDTTDVTCIAITVFLNLIFFKSPNARFLGFKKKFGPILYISYLISYYNRGL